MVNSLKLNLPKLAAMLLTVAFLGGCAGGVQMLPTLDSKTNLQPEQGIVVARFINTSAYPLPFNYLTIAPKNLNESKKIKPLRLTSLDSVVTESTIFAAPVKAGSYSLDSLYSFHSRGDYWYSRWAATDASFGTFEVKPGQVTDLGTIIYYPKPQEDKFSDEFSRIPATKPAQVLEQFFPFYQTDTNNVIGWNDEGLEEELQDKFISFAQNPVTYEESYKAENGDVYFFGKLGVIVKRTSDGEWLLDAVDTIVDMKAMVRTRQGHQLIGGNEGNIFLKMPDADEWTSVSLKSDLNVDQLYVHNDMYVDALARNDKQIEVYRANLLDAEFNWQLMATYGRDSLWRNGQGDVQASFITNNKVKPKPSKQKFTGVNFDDPNNPSQLTVETAYRVIEQTFGNANSKSFTVDLANWSVIREPSKQEFSRIKNAGYTKVGVVDAGYWSWTGQPDYFVFDAELNDWVEMSTHIVSCKSGYRVSNNSERCLAENSAETKKSHKVLPKKDSFRFISLPWFKTTKEAAAIAMLNSERVVLQTKDKGKSWAVSTGELPNSFCSTLVGDIEDSLILSCNGATGDFYQSEDMGLTWELVREHQNF